MRTVRWLAGAAISLSLFGGAAEVQAQQGAAQPVPQPSPGQPVPQPSQDQPVQPAGRGQEPPDESLSPPAEPPSSPREGDAQPRASAPAPWQAQQGAGQPVQPQMPPAEPPPSYRQGYGRQPYGVPVYEQQQPQPRLHYVRRQVSIKGLWIPGVVIFGASYALTATVAASLVSGPYASWCVVPLVGPWVALGYETSDAELAGALLGGIVQTAGAAMFVLGLALRRPVRVAVYSLDSRQRAPTLALDLLPAAGGARVGLTFRHF